MPYEPRTPESETDKAGPTARDRRRGYVLAALRDVPEAPPGSKMIYGGGHMIVAHYIEEATRTPFETLMQEQVFRPLGLSSARYGSLASAVGADGPWDHAMENGQPKAVEPTCGQQLQARSPAGRNLCMSMADLGRFVAVHLAGARERSNFLKPQTFTFLQNNRPPLNVSPGWPVGGGDWARGKLLWHSGSTGKNMALCHIAPEEDFAICVATNIGFDGAHGRMDELTQMVARMIQAGKFGTR